MSAKRIVIDLDDTISFCHDRNWSKAIPNMPVIQKMNKLVNLGWDVVIFSSRGMLSKVDYTSQVKEWLELHGVLYTGLMFGKPLASLYIDDKASSPGDFIHMEICDLSGGSGKEVVRIGNKVFKADDQYTETLKWYEKAKEILYVPDILGNTGNQIIMKYLQPIRQTKPEDIFPAIDLFKEIPPINTHHWKDYITRIKLHCLRIGSRYEIDLLSIVERLSGMGQPPHTFGHGDFNPNNAIIYSKREMIYFIDPINHVYSSWKIDLAKLIFWCMRQDEPQDIKYNPGDDWQLDQLIISEAIRTIMYKPKEEATQIINLCLELLKI